MKNFPQARSLSVSHGSNLPSSVLTATSLPEILYQAASHNTGVVYHHRDDTSDFQSYSQLLARAEIILGVLRQRGLKPQDKVILQFQSQQHFLESFWACVLGGFVSVPLAVDFKASDRFSRLVKVWQLCDRPLIVSESSLVDILAGEISDLNIVAIDNLTEVRADKDWHCGKLEDLALLMFTSGSTGTPKGVMLSRQNLLASAYGMAKTNNLSSSDIALNWMPLEHIASLVMFHLTEVRLGCQQVQVESELILQQPLKWLDLIDRYRVTATWSPNFAYNLVNERLSETAAKHHWDLSCLKWMGNGAEAVVGKTTKRFLELLTPYGLSATAVSPGYGMTETCSGITHSHDFTRNGDREFVEVGAPIPGVSIRIVDENGSVVPESTVGLLQVKGLTVTSGYYRQEELNKEIFTADGWFNTGDLGFIERGRLTLTGRQKEVIIINGVNYYSHDIETVVEAIVGVTVSYTAACGVKDSDEREQLAIFLHTEAIEDSLRKLISEIKSNVFKQIGIVPAYIIPVAKETIPKTAIGKIQRRQLNQRFEAGEFDLIINEVKNLLQNRNLTQQELPRNAIEQKLVQIWQETLNLKTVGIEDNFFELGGNSLLLMQVLSKLEAEFDRLSAVTLFQYPTIAALADYLNSNTESTGVKQGQAKGKLRRKATGNRDIAIIGMSCRFPGANNIDRFWQNLCAGVESISFFEDREILNSGVDEELLQNPNYVKASPILDNIEDFDADFWGYSAKEAQLLDPQQRLFLECAWESLEDAGYNPWEYSGEIGLYGGAATNTYLLNHIYPNRHTLDDRDSLQTINLSSMGGFQVSVANDKDYLTTRTSYKLNLTGSSINVQTACSTSLVAVHLACQSLIAGECDLALAGGVSVHTPQKMGYLYQEGMILSPDGHCRAFDEAATGTIFGSGAGMVVLKPLDKAIADDDRVYAVIKGSAVNNDGGSKVGYLAPNVDGQARAVAEALAVADISPDTIGYIEAHGTGTKLGDPIEIAALSQAFGACRGDTLTRRLTPTRIASTKYCAIGSVKTNVGHLQMASGIVGLIKTTLCLYHQKIPPSLHFQRPNPQIDFDRTPFYVNTQLQDWQSASPRRAGVNSLGIGGTNAHLILEEATVEKKNTTKQLPAYLLTLSAKNEAALSELVKNYRDYLTQHPDLNIADICFTTNIGRSHFSHRLAIVASNKQELQQQLAATNFRATPPCSQIFAYVKNIVDNQLPLTKLEPQDTEWREVLASLGQLYVAGAKINWQEFCKIGNGRRISLPTYPFQRTRYWFEPLLQTAERKTEIFSSAIASSQPHHPLLGKCVNSPVKQILFQSHLQPDTISYLQDHCLENTPVFPGTAYLEMALAVGVSQFKTTKLTLENVTIQKPLWLTTNENKSIPKIQLILNPESNSATWEIYSLDKEEWQLHSYGHVLPLTDTRRAITLSVPPKAIALKSLQQQFTNSLDVSQHYLNCRQKGINYGKSFQGIKKIWRKTGKALGLIELDNLIESNSEYYLHPALLDACLQILFAALPPELQSATYLPIGLTKLHLYHLPESKLWSYLRVTEVNDKYLTADVWLYSDCGELVAFIEGLKSQELATKPKWHDWLYHQEWRSQPLTTQSLLTESVTWLIFIDSNGIGREIANLLTSRQQQCYLVVPEGNKVTEDREIKIDRHDRSAYQQLIQLFEGQALNVVYLWGLGDREIDTKGCQSNLYLVQALLNSNCNCRFWFVTRNAQAVGNYKPTSTISQSCLWGMGKAIALEHPLSYVGIDLDAAASDNDAENIFREICAGKTEQVAYRNNRRYVARLIRSSLNQTQENRQLQITQTGNLDNLHWQTTNRKQPSHNEIEIKVRATGLNFRDLMIALGLYPDESQFLGLECTGEVTAVGTEVSNFKVGDKVMAIAASSFSQYLTVNSLLAIPKPKSLSFVEAATIPVTFLTAYYTLVHLAKLQPGERVLIHAAAGGVGLAAVQIAKDIGAEVFTTASPSKWQLLQSLGVKNIMNSRTLDFASEIMSVTDNKGVDVVLNSLSGEFIPHSISVLNSRGRFVEIGKQDVWTNEQVKQLKPDASYFIVDLWQITQEHPALVRQMLDELLAKFSTGKLKPLPHKAFNDKETVAAFRYMQQAKHQGKIAITQNYNRVNNQSFRGTYLITGGVGAIGLQVAEFLADRGVEHLVLLGRNEVKPHLKANLEKLQQNASVTVLKGDVTDSDRLTQILSQIELTLPSLKGVVHCAGVLDDGILMQQNWQRFEKVLDPKVTGAWNLHVLTQKYDLDRLILFSSASSLIGNAGQANYCAANSFLDTLAHARRAMGLPAIAINWGAWQDTGLATKVNLKPGIKAIAPSQAIEVLEQILLHAPTQIGVIPINWTEWQKYNTATPFYEDFIEHTTPESTVTDFQQQLLAAKPEARKTVITEQISSSLAKILGIKDPHTIDIHQGFSELALDSLGSVELRNKLQTDYDLELPATIVFDYSNVSAIADYLLGILFDGDSHKNTSSDFQVKDFDLDEIENLSETEAEALLQEQLKQWNFD